jgi:sialidase-1
MKKSLIFLLFFLFASAPVFAGDTEPFRADIFIGGHDGYPTYRIPALVVSKKGTILAFCEGRKTGILDHGNIDLVLKRSFDRGATWGPLQVIESEGFKTWGNPSPVVDRDTGVIRLLFCLNNDRVFLTESQDDGATWAKPREITAQVKKPGWTWYATGPGHAIQLASGRILVPCDHAEKTDMASHLIFSDDHGATWKLGGILANGTDECMAVEAADGRVYLSMRNAFKKNLRAYSWSDDRGQTWSPVQMDSTLIDSTCQAGIARLTLQKGQGKNRILFLNPASNKRDNMAFRLSYDEARTWSAPVTINAGPSAYSDLAVLSDLSVAAIFENGKVWPYQKISFDRMDFDWVTREEK